MTDIPIVSIDGTNSVEIIIPTYNVIGVTPPTLVITDEKPIVRIYPGSGSIMDASAIMTTLDGALDIGQFAPGLTEDITLLRDLWTVVGRNIQDVLVNADVTSIVRTSTEYTDSEINTMAVNVQLIDGVVQSNTSLINQTASNITLRVDAVELDAANNLLVQTARIDITETGIASNVTRMDATDSIIQTAQSTITQNADAIVAEVTARELLASGAVSTNTSTSTQTALALVDVVNSNSQLTGRADSAETRLTATEQITTINSQDLANAQYSITAVQSLTSSRFGVTITEDGSGIPYVAGFEMLVHPQWIEGTTYRVDELMHSVAGDLIYKCILDHDATLGNYPTGTSNTWWELQDNAPSSAFNISADSFSVITPGGLVPIFVIDGGTGAVSINGSLIVGSIESTNYAAQVPTESWFSLNPDTGTADFNNMTMSFGNGTTTTTVDGGFLTTGIITNHATTPTLDINFNTATITVNAASGLVINSVGGMQVNNGGSLYVNSGGHIAVYGGGDIRLASSSSASNSELRFTTVAANPILSITPQWTGGTQNGVDLYCSSTNQAHRILNFGKTTNWWEINSRATTTVIDTSASGSSYRGYLSVNQSSTVIGLTDIPNGRSASINFNTVIAGSAVINSSHNIEVNAGTSIKQSVGNHGIEMIGSVVVHTGLTLMANTDTTYDSLIPGEGDYFTFVRNNGLGEIWARRRHGNGSVVTTRVV